ncbi:hypothetical protein CR513_37783, partial [Mucuna pruriens]
MDRSMIDAASGGALMDKTPTAARHLISNMASNTQQFGIREPSQPRMIELTSLVRQLAVGQHQPNIAARVCGICTFVEHPTDMCSTLQETEVESRAICSSTIQIYLQCTSKTSMLPTIKSTISSTTVPTAATTENATSRQFTISRGPNEIDLKTQIRQLANIVSHLQLAGSNNLPSQTIPNSRGNASVLTLRSEKELPQPAPQYRIPTHRCRNKIKLSDCRFQHGPSQQGSLNLTNSC